MPHSMHSNDAKDRSEQVPRRTIHERARTVAHTIKVHFKSHVGAGIMASVAYFDPGNWSVDLEAGSQFGYRLLFIVLLASLGATLLQTLSCKLGCVTGADLAVHNRLKFGNHKKHPKLFRWLVLVPLYIAAEIGIIATDLAELLGSAIALSLLIGPKFPLWGGVLLTAADVFLLLLFTATNNGRPARALEGLVVLLVMATFICFIVLIVQVAPHWPSVFEGYLPSEQLIKGGAIYTSIGIIGATIMPHALFLGSSLATLDRVARDVQTPLPPSPESIAAMRPYTRMEIVSSSMKRLFAVEKSVDARKITTHDEWENSSLKFIRSHLKHAIVDIVISLLSCAMLINSAILVVAAAVFFQSGNKDSAGLFDAHALITRVVGKPAATLFAVALLCAGQSASLTATLAGQVVSEGYINWRIGPVARRLITRGIGLVPAAIVAAAYGPRGIDSLLVGSQVALSFVLPFTAFPLVWFTSSKAIMRVRAPDNTSGFCGGSTTAVHGRTTDESGPSRPTVEREDSKETNGEKVDTTRPTVGREESEADKVEVARPQDDVVSVLEQGQAKEKWIDFSNGWILMGLGYLVCTVVLVANVYAIVSLAKGE